MTRELQRIRRNSYIRMIFRQFPGALWITDRELRLTYVAGRLVDGVKKGVRPGMSVFDIVGTHDPSHTVIARHRAALAGESQSFEYEFQNRWYVILIDQLQSGAGTVRGCIAAAFDITENRLTRERLTRSESMLEQAQRLAHIGSFEWDMTARTVIWSDELYRIFGIEPGRFAGTYEAFLERVHPDDAERISVTIFNALRGDGNGPLVFEHRIVRADGSIGVLHTRGDVVRDRDGRVVRVAGCCWDVTAMRTAMDKLERAHSLLESTIQATADGLLVVDRDGKVSTHNRRFLSLWNIPEELARLDDDEKLLAYVCDQLENPEHFLASTHTLYENPERESFDVLHFRDGRVYERYSTPQRIGGQPVGRVWSFRDITEREKLFRRALFLSDATRLLSSLDVEPALDSLAHMSVPYMGEVCAIDLLGGGQPRRLLVVSQNGSESFNPGLHNAVMAGHSVIYSIGSRSCMAVPLLIKDSVVGAMTFMAPAMRRYSDQDLEFAETLAQRAALSVENARLYRGSQEALQARDEFLAVAAHEIRGPITSIHMAVQGLRRGKVAPEALPKIYDIIEREDRRLTRFVHELLDLGRIQSGQLYFNFEEVDFGSVVRHVAGNMHEEIAQSGSAMSVTTEGHPVGQWDKSRLEQVATNLLSNAIKFGRGKPIMVSVREHDGVTTLEVQDHGVGIPAEMHEKIFHPFERAVSARHYGGLGLGLFIVRTIVEGLGGTVRVESAPNAGATFTVELRGTKQP